jgi:transcriptional regulator with XRE-family HTH domain
VSSFAEILRKIMFEKRLKAVDLAKGTNIAPSVISRYLSGQNQPSRDNIITIGNYLGAHPQSLLSSSDAPESSESSRHISSDKDKIIAVQEELIKNLQKQVGGLEKQVKELEDMATTISEKNSQKTKNPTKPNKQKVGFMKKHKPKK